jgi:hypothetical protein
VLQNSHLLQVLPVKHFLVIVEFFSLADWNQDQFRGQQMDAFAERNFVV